MAYRDKERAKEYLAAWHARNKERRRIRWQARYASDEDFRKKRNEYMAAYRDQQKARVYEALGNKCGCCGEQLPTMLALDHVRNDGKADRDGQRRSGVRFYKKVLDAGCPPDRYQILCHSCNQSKHINGGTCEHKTTVYRFMREALLGGVV